MDSLVNIKAFNEFINSKFDGNLTRASVEMEIPKSTLCLLRNGSRDVGKKSILKLKTYCEKNNIEIKNILFF